MRIWSVIRRYSWRDIQKRNAPIGTWLHLFVGEGSQMSGWTSVGSTNHRSPSKSLIPLVRRPKRAGAGTRTVGCDLSHKSDYREWQLVTSSVTISSWSESNECSRLVFGRRSGTGRAFRDGSRFCHMFPSEVFHRDSVAPTSTNVGHLW